MFDFLFEGRQSVYLALVALAVVLVALWARSGFGLWAAADDRAKSKGRPGWLPLAIGLLALLALTYFLLDRVVETRHEQIQRKLQEMAAAVKARNTDRLFANISDRFKHGALDKAAFRGLCQRAMDDGWVEELVLWDVTFPDEAGHVDYKAKPKGRRMPDNVGFPVKALFVLDPDGQWRLQDFEIFDPVGDGRTPMQLPTP